MRLFANSKLAPSVVPVTKENGLEWSGTLEVTMEGYPASGWPVVEVAPTGAGKMVLLLIKTQADWASTYLVRGERMRELEPFGEPVVTTYRYTFVAGDKPPTSLLVRWQDRADAQAEWREEDETGKPEVGK